MKLPSACLNSNNLRFWFQYLDSWLGGVRGRWGSAPGPRVLRCGSGERMARRTPPNQEFCSSSLTRPPEWRCQPERVGAATFAGPRPAREGDYPRQNCHHRLFRPSARTFAPRSWCSWSICRFFVSSSCVRFPIWASSTSTTLSVACELILGLPGVSSVGSSTCHRPLSFLACRFPSAIRRRIVSVLTPCCAAASAMLGMVTTSSVPMLGKSLGACLCSALQGLGSLLVLSW